jgi:MOSC domain-containing protein YiiM
VSKAVEAIGSVQSVNLGRPRAVEWQGRPVTSAIWKVPVTGLVPVRGANLYGDEQADRRVHGGPDKAVYAYSAEDYAWWEGELGWRLSPGTFGENLTVSLDSLGDALVGERWLVGSCELEVCQPRLPCYKLGMKMGDPNFLRRFGDAGRPGAYLRIIRDGDVAAGDEICLVSRPHHDVSVRLVSQALLGDHDLAPHLLEAQALPEALHRWARERLPR